MSENSSVRMSSQDLDQARSWIDILHGISPGLIHVCHTGNWSGQTFDWSTDSGQERALGYISSQDAQEGIYLRCTTISRQPERGSRGPESDSVALPGLWADMDLAGPGHKTSNPLPVTFEDAKAIIESSGLPRPTLWIHSGGGLYPWWLFDQPLALPESSTLSLAKKLSAQWHDALAAGAEKIGFHYGLGTQDMARVLRLPGTTNRKAGLERPCRIIEQEGRTYSLEEMLVAAARVTPAPVPVAPRVPGPGSGGIRPGDDFNERADWSDAELLGGAGWTEVARIGREIRWRKPGSRSREHHATTGREGLGADDRLWVFSTETEFDPQTPLTKFHVYAVLHHGGDYSAATKTLAAMGYGESLKQPEPRKELAEFNYDLRPPIYGEPVVVPAAMSVRPRGREDWTVTGVVSVLHDRYGQDLRYVEDGEYWRVWNGRFWEKDQRGVAVVRLYEAYTEELMDKRDQLRQDDPESPLLKPLTRFVTQLRNSGRTTVRHLLSEKVQVKAEIFDANPRYLNLENGVFDLGERKFLPFDRSLMMTKMSRFVYDPDAKAPEAESFFSSLLPDESVRDYLLRALAYGMTGENDQKAIFVLQGKSNCGKTQVIELLKTLMGGYAESVSPTAFMRRSDPGAPTPGLHKLRSARMGFTSETMRDGTLDEAMLKRISGKDTMSTRTLHEDEQEWIPQVAMFIATNNLPRLSSDDEAMWKRVKTIRFDQVFSDDGSTGNQAVANIGRNLAAKEAAGIFNLLLSALDRYRSDGRLVEPEEVKKSNLDHRVEVDPAARWLQGVLASKTVVEVDSDVETWSRHIYSDYKHWCEDEDIKPMGPQRLGFFLKEHLRYTTRDSNKRTYYVGIQYNGAKWLSSGRLPQTNGWREDE